MLTWHLSRLLIIKAGNCLPHRNKAHKDHIFICPLLSPASLFTSNKKRASTSSCDPILPSLHALLLVRFKQGSKKGSDPFVEPLTPEWKNKTLHPLNPISSPLNTKSRARKKGRGPVFSAYGASHEGGV